MIKRLFDLVVAGSALLVLSPILLPLALVLRCTGEGYVFYRQRRLGRHWREFDILKFATMLKDSPSLPGGDITIGADPRILPVGRVLRDTKLNELPQLINIVRGDMSLVGPRPMTARVIDLFPASHRDAIGTLRPGLTGVGSIVFRGEEALLSGVADRERVYREVIAPYKSELETWYAARQSLRLDLLLILLTAGAVVSPTLNVRRFLPDLPPEPAALRIAIEASRAEAMASG